ncbi:MAG TPA: hypothetical protein VL981_06005 [Candidatus Methylacidiphilales bacterium]|nr:hypothetical protein [Candidatus Methylacidiphilales bacterium]
MATNSALSNFAERLNAFLYRQHIRRLGPAEIALAQEWSMAVIRREHPHFSQEQADEFYEKLIQIRAYAVDEWSQRMN